MSSMHKSKNKKPPEGLLRRFWNFLWYDDSLLSWVVSFVLAFVFIKFIFYPVLAFIVGSAYPIVAVVSGSMEHKLATSCPEGYVQGTCVEEVGNICGRQIIGEKGRVGFDTFWDLCGSWYEQKGIDKSMFMNFRFSSGFNKGDVMLLHGEKPEHIAVGDVIVFLTPQGVPIIHRVVGINSQQGIYIFETKGDHNEDQIVSRNLNEQYVTYDRYVGTAYAKIPFVGYVKVWFSSLLGLL